MAISSDDFKNGMRRLAASVTVVTSAHDGVKAGLTATAVCSLSAQPPRLIVCVNKSGLTFETIEKSNNICVNILSHDQQQYAMRFAGMMAEGEDERFEADVWEAGVTGAPVFKEALVSFECKVDQITDGGSHGIIICDVVDIQMQDRSTDPLLYMDGQWASLNLEAATSK